MKPSGDVDENQGGPWILSSPSGLCHVPFDLMAPSFPGGLLSTTPLSKAVGLALHPITPKF